MEGPPAQFVGTVVNVPVIFQINQVTKWVEIPRTLFIDKVVDVLYGTTGPSVSDCAEDQESPTGAVHERMHVADVPVPHVALNERISERVHEQVFDVPVPQKIKENVDRGVEIQPPVAVQRQVPQLQTGVSPSIKQVTKHAYFPRTQYIDKIVDMLVVMQRMVLRIQTGNKQSINEVTKYALFPQIQYIDKVIVDMRGTLQRQVPQILTPLKTVEVPPALFVGRAVEAPVIMQMRRLSLRQCRSFARTHFRAHCRGEWYGGERPTVHPVHWFLQGSARSRSTVLVCPSLVAIDSVN